MQITLGNLNEGHVLHIVPTKLSEVFTPEGKMKFTVIGGKPGQPLLLFNDLAFTAEVMFVQTQKSKVNFGPCGGDARLITAPPKSQVVHDQASVYCYRNPKTGYCDVKNAEYFKVEFVDGSPCTFTANVK